MGLLDHAHIVGPISNAQGGVAPALDQGSDLRLLLWADSTAHHCRTLRSNLARAQGELWCNVYSRKHLDKDALCCTVSIDAGWPSQVLLWKPINTSETSRSCPWQDHTLMEASYCCAALYKGAAAL